MFQVTPAMKIRVVHDPINFRNGIDGIAALVRRLIESDPMNGGLYVFRNRRMTMIRFLYYDGQGFYLCTKRLSKGKFTWWPTRDQPHIAAREFQVLLWAGNPSQMAFAKDWKEVA
jgi:transposase